ncbi:hypothetical protein JKA74_00665 [Marivirga sp. S37H4]|uniref:NAD glycohydrolase translocation F5/8 type C domain-containing protein n=1 Tax=Marivirga aurantiaca TaxID=2802615 RepID=A0A935C4Y4_9BACT|nr:hypothetical protein [Marivirga aurantiaca]MBK6263529.1 hypothetical protein [Marivirga aurantiaca]
MKILTTIILVAASFNLSAQEILSLEPTNIYDLDFGPQAQKEWQIRDQALKAISSGELKWDDMTEEQEKYVLKYGEIYRDMWDILGDGCSWYCGGGVKDIKSSSSLEPSGNITYKGQNAHDFSYETAWVEGVPGHGIGEYLEYSFSATSPRITEVIIINGYVKSKAVWQANSRVKKLQLYYNNKPYAILNLEDKVAEQTFKLDQAFGYANRTDMEVLKLEKDWSLRFEILEVYEGAKYSDTVISEIYFNGIDVH